MLSTEQKSKLPRKGIICIDTAMGSSHTEISRGTHHTEQDTHPQGHRPPETLRHTQAERHPAGC